MSTVAENQVKTMYSLFEGYNEYTVEGVMRARADGCTHAILPTSLNRPTKTNDEYAEWFANLRGHMRSFKVSVKRIVNDPEHHSLACYATGEGDSHIAPYRGEYAFFMEFNDAGDKITKIEEFVDSGFARDYLAKVIEWQNQKEATPTSN